MGNHWATVSLTLKAASTRAAMTVWPGTCFVFRQRVSSAKMAVEQRAGHGGGQCSDDLAAIEDRRRFLLSAGKFAVAVPPTMTLLLSTTMSSSAIAQSGGSVNPTNPDNPPGPGPGPGP